MEVSLRYADINTQKYSPYKSFSGDQTYKDKSFNLKIKLIEETTRFPELSVGFRDFIGTGKFSSEYLVSSKKIGDFDFTVGLGWGSLSNEKGIKNPLNNIDQSFLTRPTDFGEGGDFEIQRWFRGPKASAFYGFSYLNKYSGLRFKMDYDESTPFLVRKKSNFSFGLAIPASKLIDINIFKHRGIDLGFGLSYKANYSKNIIQKNDHIKSLTFSEEDQTLLSKNDDVFTGTINALLAAYEIYTQDVYLSSDNLFITVNQNKYRNLNLAAKRVVQIIDDVLLSRKIDKLSIIFQTGNVNTSLIEFPLSKFRKFLDNSLTLAEIKHNIIYENYHETSNSKLLFEGQIDFPLYNWWIKPDLKNHVGAPEAYSGQLGLLLGRNIISEKLILSINSWTRNLKTLIN